MIWEDIGKKQNRKTFLYFNIAIIKLPSDSFDVRLELSSSELEARSCFSATAITNERQTSRNEIIVFCLLDIIKLLTNF